jgi:hypothetical protein
VDRTKEELLALALRSKEIQYAWNNRSGLDRALVTWAFRISCYDWIHSCRPRCGLGAPRRPFIDREKLHSVEG